MRLRVYNELDKPSYLLHTQIMPTTKTAATLPADVKVHRNAYGLHLMDADVDPTAGEHGARWWPTERCDDEDDLAAAYANGAGQWHT